jgi:DNA polymerase-3 subunit epsilon
MSKIRTVVIVDTETSGLSPATDHVIELGYVLWSVEHRCMLEVFSGLLPCATNAAEAVNGIPQAALPSEGEEWQDTWDLLDGAICRADAVCAHQADFDRAFCERHVKTDKPWICTREDVRFPRAGTGTSLIATALAHGVAVVAAHRAINDCLTLVRLFEAVPDIAERLEAGLAHAMLPKVRLMSLAPYEERETVKAHGFKWLPELKIWVRTMAVQDAAALPFRTRQVEL